MVAVGVTLDVVLFLAVVLTLEHVTAVMVAFDVLRLLVLVLVLDLFVRHFV
jgi:hypothetical protein